MQLSCSYTVYPNWIKREYAPSSTNKFPNQDGCKNKYNKVRMTLVHFFSLKYLATACRSGTLFSLFSSFSWLGAQDTFWHGCVFVWCWARVQVFFDSPPCALCLHHCPRPPCLPRPFPVTLSHYRSLCSPVAFGATIISTLFILPFVFLSLSVCCISVWPHVSSSSWITLPLV